MKIIGVAGQMRAAKDTIADRLQESKISQEQWERFAFATPLKKIYCNSFGVDAAFIEEWKVKNECPPNMSKTVRQALQFIGDGYREIMPVIWVKKTFDYMASGNGNYILSDVRYLNEAKAIKDAGGLVILVWRKDWENDDPNRSEQEVKPLAMWCKESGQEGWIEDIDYPDAPSERHLFDIFIRNDGTLEQLHEKIDTWVRTACGEFFYGV